MKTAARQQPATPRRLKAQRGGFVMGLVVGLLIGLALALGVALYVTKVPVPFMNKVPQRTAEQDAAEAEKNKNWDPNSPLYGRNPARPASVPAAPAAPLVDPGTAALPGTDPASAATAARARAAASAPGSTVSTRDPAAILADRPGASPTLAAASAAGLSTTPSAEAFRYFVQVGAYGATDEAEQQRARLAMLGFIARVTERDQAGRVVYRVRLGPYDKKEDADSAKERLDGAGLESALVRVQK